MNSLHDFGLNLVAEVSRIESLGRKFRGGRTKFDADNVWVGLLVLSGIVLGFWLLSRLKDRQESFRRVNSPRKLFRELCKAHGLKFFQRRLLKQVARWQRLARPAKLFLEPERLETRNLSSRLRARQVALAAISKKLFAEQGP